MKPLVRNTVGWTLIELLVVIAFLAILFSLMPCAMPQNRQKSRRVLCVNNLKQIALGFHVYAIDRDGQFPWMLSTNQAGSMEFTNSADVFEHFRVASNELVSAKILTCLADNRSRASDFTQFSNTNLSYFISVDVRPHETNSGQSILSGDRNILGGKALNESVRVVRKSDKLGWSKEIHRKAGNVVFVDGSVLQVDGVGLNKTIAAITNAAVRLAIP